MMMHGLANLKQFLLFLYGTDAQKVVKKRLIKQNFIPWLKEVLTS